MDSESAVYTVGLMAGRPPTREAPFFGQQLAALRKRRGLSQAQLADKLDTTRKVIDYYERRAQNPTLEFMQRAAAALNVSLAELLGERSRRKPGPAPALQRKLEEIQKLPRAKQQAIMQVLDMALHKD